MSTDRANLIGPAGPLLKEIVTRTAAKKNGTLDPDRALWIYSAHDITVVNLLNAMGLYERTLVPYAAVLLVELRLNRSGEHVVTVSVAADLWFIRRYDR